MKKKIPKKGNLSYESDGKMGRQNTNNSKKEKAEFFNTTQNSE